MADYYHWQGNTLFLHVQAQPRASKDEIVGPQGNSLKIRITAPPVDGKANQHLIKFLAKSFKVSRGKIELISGETSRIKRFSIHEPQHLPPCIAAN